MERLRPHARRAKAYAESWSDKTWIAASIVLFAFLVLLQIQFVAMRLSESVLWSWSATFTPFWIIYAGTGSALFLYLILAASPASFASDKKSGKAREKKIRATTAIAVLSMLFASNVMLVQRLDGSEDHTYFEIAGPLYAGAAVIGVFGLAALFFNLPEFPADDELGVVP